MKKIYVFIFLLLGAGFTFSKEVEKSKASLVAKNFYNQNTHLGIPDEAVSLVYECKENSNRPVYYIYNMNGNEGFVIVSAEDLVQPILAYSNSGSYSPAQVPPSVAFWLKGYEKQILSVREKNTSTTAEVARQWSVYFNNETPANSQARMHTVNPLCQTKWNQAPNENGMCPFDQQYNEHCVTGCPATAMAQIMKYWAYPEQGTGFHSYNEQHYGTLSANFGSTTYNWAGMPNILTSPNNDVATLMFHCGVGVEMNYGVAATGGSGSYVCVDFSPSVNQTCENAYKTFFGYDPTIAGKLRANFSDASWTSMVKGELDASRPIQYAGFGGGGGHTWVCDGYDQNDLFHMNWGWGGNSDGYFSLNDLDPTSLGAGGGTGGFNNNQQMLIGIKPLGGGGGGGGTVNQDGISLHAAITVNFNPIVVGSHLTAYTEIQNIGTADFTGDVAAALFNSDGVFLTYIQEFTNVTLNAGLFYQFQFDLASLDVIPGLCYIGVFYKNASDQYSLVAKETFDNPVGLTVTGPYSDLQMYSNSTLSPTSPHVNQAFSVTANLANAGGSDFNGWLSADLYTLEGDYVTNIEEISGVTMSAGFYYPTTFYTAGLAVAPGTYYIAYWASADHNNWEFFYNANYPNPIEVVITDPSLSPDAYENDDDEAHAHVFPVNFAGNNADVVTSGSNIHVANDLDFYKIVLPSGNGYVITAAADDSYHSTTGTYTNDVQWSCSIDGGNTYSTTFDDVYNGSILLPNGGSVIFFVANYFAGTTGTYQLNIHIVKGPISVEEIDRTALVLFPNPARQSFAINGNDLYGNFKLKIFNQLGSIVKENEIFLDHSQLFTDIRDLLPGSYDVLLEGDHKSFSARLIVE